MKIKCNKYSPNFTADFDRLSVFDHFVADHAGALGPLDALSLVKDATLRTEASFEALLLALLIFGLGEAAGVADFSALLVLHTVLALQSCVSKSIRVGHI